MIFDEEYGSRFARALGLASFDTRITVFNDTAALVIERYDRDRAAGDGRIHQEDFNQILELAGDEKYQRYGDKGLRDIARQLDERDKRKLLVMATLSVAIGNLDMHAKNIAVLHPHDGSTYLAPMYDVVPQTHQDNDGELAFAVGGEFEHRLITRDLILSEAKSWELDDSAKIVDDTLVAVRVLAENEHPHPAAHPELRYDVIRFTDNLMGGRRAGDNGDGTFVDRSSGDSAGGAWTNPVFPLR